MAEAAVLCSGGGWVVVVEVCGGGGCAPAAAAAGLSLSLWRRQLILQWRRQDILVVSAAADLGSGGGELLSRFS